MTLKVRLAAMMIVLLGAVMAAQYLLLQREQRVLASRLESLTRHIDESTRLLSDRTRDRLAHPAADLRKILEEFPPEASTDSMAVVVMVHGDTVLVSDDADTPHELRRQWRGSNALVELEAELARISRVGRVREQRQFVSEACDTVRMTKTSILRGGDADDSAAVRLVFLGLSGPGEEERFEIVAEEEALPAGMLKINVPWVSDEGGPSHVELIYPTEGLTEELDRARRRSGFWLTGLLGVGAVAAVLVAAQFTRPIRSLQDSFGRVQDGDLSVEVTPERPDEIGKLTASFNGMVARLRESREIEHRLAESERLAAVGTLAAGVAHEVRNPLNAMLLTLEQLSKNTAPPEGTEERARFDRYVRNVTSELSRLERMVGTFLDLSRDEQMAGERVDVSDSVRAAVELFTPEAAGRGVVLQAEVEDALHVQGDVERLRTVWNNLITNALQAVPDGGRIRVRAESSGSDVIVQVVDEGRGIDESELGKIWEPFYSGRPEGTGLGLALVRAIVERHGGRAEARSAKGRGTTIRVVFPGESA